MQHRKVPPSEAATWPAARPAHARPLVPTPAETRALLRPLRDRHGLTRIDRPGAAGGEHAWRARVYTRGVELHKQFSDAVYGGTAGALRAAVAWRDRMRHIAGPRPPGPGWTPRIVRAEYGRNCGWLAYSPRKKRYFADSAWGGREAGYAQAQAWLAKQVTGD